MHRWRWAKADAAMPITCCLLFQTDTYRTDRMIAGLDSRGRSHAIECIDRVVLGI
jgi:hypothetical protein